MNTHEYQAKQILGKWDLAIPAFKVVSTLEEAERAIQELGLEEAVLKIQVHAGGRGKGGGVKLVSSREEILREVKQMLGIHFVNTQTGPQGVDVSQVLISEKVEIEKEFYLGVVIDRVLARAVLIASAEGGMEIEEVARDHPDRILQIPIGLDGTIKPYHLIRLSRFMGWDKELAQQGRHIAQALGQAFVETDASLLEINPLVLDNRGKLWVVDAKLSVDDNALFRQTHLASQFDRSQLSDQEILAHQHHLSYISLEGNIGCMVNGAGLAMATMDIIRSYGGDPANFLDVGGGADKEKVKAGFKIILSDPGVEAILVNIFGGIMNCATLAEGVIGAVEELGVRLPIVIRLEGTHMEEGHRRLDRSALPLIRADGMKEAATKVMDAIANG